MENIKQLPALPLNTLQPLYDLLKTRTIPLKLVLNNRKNFPRHRGITFGITTGRFNRKTELSYHSRLPTWKPVYDEIMKLGREYCPIDFCSVHLTQDCVSPAHLDVGNDGESMLVSFGDYQGNNLIIEGKEYDARYTPIVFHAGKNKHWNTPQVSGTKYSLIYFRLKKHRGINIS